MKPKLIHTGYFWEPPPVWAQRNAAEFKTMNPDCEVRLWSHMPAGFPKALAEAFADAPTFRFRSDLVRYWILQQQGGIWVDADTRPVRPFTDRFFVDGIFAAENGTCADNFFMGSSKHHPAWQRILDRCQDRSGWVEPDHWFGTVNVLVDRNFEPLDPELVVLPDRLVCYSRYAEAECYEMVMDPREPPAAHAGAFIKHYAMSGGGSFPVYDANEARMARNLIERQRKRFLKG